MNTRFSFSFGKNMWCGALMIYILLSFMSVSHEQSAVISVRLWNIKDGSLKVRFWAKNQLTPKEKVFKNPYGECQFIKNWA